MHKWRLNLNKNTQTSLGSHSCENRKANDVQSIVIQIGHFRVLVPLFQNESKCETFQMKMSSACSFIFMHIEVTLHFDSL